MFLSINSFLSLMLPKVALNNLILSSTIYQLGSSEKTISQHNEINVFTFHLLILAYKRIMLHRNGDDAVM